MHIRVGLFAFLMGCVGCEGERGPAGAAGEDGTNGTNGTDGNDGTNGLECWDVNRDGIMDAAEDINGDGAWDTLDCRGAAATGYVGSDTCQTCHDEQFAGWVNSGHPYKIVPKDEILAGTGYPDFVQATHTEEFAVDDDFFADQAGLMSINADTFPNGGWDDVSYVIGGYGWKARFIGTDGYIITGTDKGNADPTDDDKVQFNFPIDPDVSGHGAYGAKAATSATYHTGEMKPYDCGGCHTTGWVPDTDAASDGDLTDNQDGLAGIHGTWSEPGIACEACHGPGAAHSDDPENVMTAGDPEQACQSCHIRGYRWEIDTSGGYIKHHEQSEEMLQSQHLAIGCSGCHDSHQPVKYQAEYMALDSDPADPDPTDPNPDYINRPGNRVNCESCHVLEALAYDDWAEDYGAMTMVTCEGCHMPKAAKSGHAVGTYYGDVTSHMFSINPGADFTADPTVSTTGKNPANPYLSLDWSCGSCHADLAEDATFDFYTWASSRVEGIHGSFVPEPDKEFVGMSACVTCHQEYVQNVAATGHPYKIVDADAAVAGTGYPEYVQLAQTEAAAIDADFFTDQSVLTIDGDTFPSADPWDDVSYLIGGYGWKTRFIGNDGFIITGQTDDRVQYNFPFDPELTSNGAYAALPETSATYHTGELKPYNCGTCHTTGWVPDPVTIPGYDPLTATIADWQAVDSDLSNNQDGMIGIRGTWAEPGVTCEGCHGPASLHVASPLENPMPVQLASESCATCHTRGSDWTDIDTSGGFVRHHEQYEEMTASKHFGKLECVTCHDPHRPVKYVDEFLAAEGETWDPVPDFANQSGIRRKCQDCHVAETIGWQNSLVGGIMEAGGETIDCVDCHMPRITKSAVKPGERSGDLRTHIFDIDSTVDIDAELTLHTAGAASGDANRYTSLDWACGGCHAEEYDADGSDATPNDGLIYEWATTIDPTTIH